MLQFKNIICGDSKSLYTFIIIPIILHSVTFSEYLVNVKTIYSLYHLPATVLLLHILK